MKKGIIYYLRKHHSPLQTSMQENARAVIDVIDLNGCVHGHYIDDPFTTFICMKHEFSKIFSNTNIKNKRK